jgi:hypothetical protein
MGHSRRTDSKKLKTEDSRQQIAEEGERGAREEGSLGKKVAIHSAKANARKFEEQFIRAAVFHKYVTTNVSSDKHVSTGCARGKRGELRDERKYLTMSYKMLYKV